MTEQELKEIEARANAATPGPWEVNFAGDLVQTSHVNGTSRSVKEIIGLTHGNFVIWNSKDDTAFVAHAREDVPKLIAEVARLRVLIKKLESSITYACGDAPACGMSYCYFCEHDPGQEHTSDCSAFTPEGEVK